MNKTIAALLTVHNRKDKTMSCLLELVKQKLPEDIKLDIYLTDDGSTDGTAEAVKTEFPFVTVINGDGSLYWNRGMIKAWAESEKKDYDYYLLLNDDTILFDGVLSEMYEQSSNYASSIIVGATVDRENKRITYGGRDKYNGLITTFNGITKCDTFNGNVVLIPKVVYRKIGKLDPTFHHGIGDTDYGLRATSAGFECLIFPHPVGICDSHEKLPKWCDSSVPVFKRIKYLYAPGGNGNNPIQFFIYRKRHYGLLAAVKSFITNHIRAIFPNIRKKEPNKY